MKQIVCLTIVLATQLPVFACGGPQSYLREFAKNAVAPDADTARAAIAALRDAGPTGLTALLSAHADLLAKERAAEAESVASAEAMRATPEWQRLAAALDAVGRVRDCDTCRLYWYTDLDAAKAAARTSGKPILSLRLLGKLDDELSCANSRFFRTAYYANEQIGDLLRDRFVLHWESVRPAPVITIDFGDGRELKRTITGNSIHYVLDEDGRVIDALPGLIAPQRFQMALRRTADIYA